MTDLIKEIKEETKTMKCVEHNKIALITLDGDSYKASCCDDFKQKILSHIKKNMKKIVLRMLTRGL